MSIICATIIVMKGILILGLMFLSMAAYAKPSQNLSKQQLQFVEMLVPKINKANQNIVYVRKHLIYLHYAWQKGKSFNTNEKQWLYKLADSYKVTKPNWSKNKTWKLLLRRVDIVPDSLVLAQAITESGWGKSYFAQKGNNYFGQWCFATGCGIVPRQRPEGAKFEVRKYSSPYASVQSYMRNINTNASYVELRGLREQIRMNHDVITGMVLSEGLSRYSAKGQDYVKIIQNIISKYNLGQFDQA